MLPFIPFPPFFHHFASNTPKTAAIAKQSICSISRGIVMNNLSIKCAGSYIAKRLFHAFHAIIIRNSTHIHCVQLLKYWRMTRFDSGSSVAIRLLVTPRDRPSSLRMVEIGRLVISLYNFRQNRNVQEKQRARASDPPHCHSRCLDRLPTHSLHREYPYYPSW